MKQGATPEKTKIEHSEIRHSLLRPVPDEVEWRTNPKCSTACGLAVALGCDQITKQTQIFAFSHQKQRLPKKQSQIKAIYPVKPVYSVKNAVLQNKPNFITRLTLS